MKIRINIQWSAVLNQPRYSDTLVGCSVAGYIPVIIPATGPTEVWRDVRTLQCPEIRTTGRTIVGKLPRTCTKPDGGCNVEPNIHTLQGIAK